MKLDNKFILDATCGGRTIWHEKNKQNPNTLYIDIRQELDPEFARSSHHRTAIFNIDPDQIQDFRNLPYPDKSFKLVVWDPPHITKKDGQKKLTGIITKKYGALNAETWQYDLKKGFDELWRVLEDHGILIFKFHDGSIKHKEVLKLFHTNPLFGTTTAKRNHNTCRWFCFMKIPKESGGITLTPQDKLEGT